MFVFNFYLEMQDIIGLMSAVDSEILNRKFYYICPIKK